MTFNSAVNFAVSVLPESTKLGLHDKSSEKRKIASIELEIILSSMLPSNETRKFQDMSVVNLIIIIILLRL